MNERQLLPVVQRMVARRRRNGLTRAQAFKAMHHRGFPVTLTTFQKWETGERKPARIAALDLETFLEQHPVVTPAVKPPNAGADA